MRNIQETQRGIFQYLAHKFIKCQQTSEIDFKVEILFKLYVAKEKSFIILIEI